MNAHLQQGLYISRYLPHSLLCDASCLAHFSTAYTRARIASTVENKSFDPSTLSRFRMAEVRHRTQHTGPFKGYKVCKTLNVDMCFTSKWLLSKSAEGS